MSRGIRVPGRQPRTGRRSAEGLLPTRRMHRALPPDRGADMACWSPSVGRLRLANPPCRPRAAASETGERGRTPPRAAARGRCDARRRPGDLGPNAPFWTWLRLCRWTILWLPRNTLVSAHGPEFPSAPGRPDEHRGAEPDAAPTPGARNIRMARKLLGSCASSQPRDASAPRRGTRSPAGTGAQLRGLGTGGSSTELWPDAAYPAFGVSLRCPTGSTMANPVSISATSTVHGPRTGWAGSKCDLEGRPHRRAPRRRRQGPARPPVPRMDAEVRFHAPSRCRSWARSLTSAGSSPTRIPSGRADHRAGPEDDAVNLQFDAALPRAAWRSCGGCCPALSPRAAVWRWRRGRGWRR